MQTLTFKAEGQRLERTDKLKPVVGSKGYLRCEFELDEEWDDLDVTIKFLSRGSEMSIPLDDGGCMVPTHATRSKWFQVALLGMTEEIMIKTNSVTVFQEVV